MADNTNPEPGAPEAVAALAEPEDKGELMFDASAALDAACRTSGFPVRIGLVRAVIRTCDAHMDFVIAADDDGGQALTDLMDAIGALALAVSSEFGLSLEQAKTALNLADAYYNFMDDDD